MSAARPRARWSTKTLAFGTPLAFYVVPYLFCPAAAHAESGGGSVSIAVDSDGIVHAAHIDESGSTYYVKYSYRSGSSWTTGRLIESSTGGNYFLNTWIGLGSSGNVHVSWVRGWNYGSVMHACKNSDWLPHIVESGASPNSCGYDDTAMAVYGDTAHLLYERRNGTSDQLKYARSACDTPVGQEVLASSGYDGTAAATYDASGSLHCVYLASGTLYYRQRASDGSWQSSQTIHSGIGNWYWARPGIAMDSAGKLHVTYSGANIGNKPYYANSVSGSWAVNGVIDAGANCDGGFCRVAMAPDDSLHVVYWDANGSKLMYAKSADNGTAWSRAQKGNQDEAGGCDIAVDQNGWAHLAYEHNRQLSYQRFCALPVTPPTSIVANPNPAWRGQDVTLTATGGSGGTIVWYEGGCGNGAPMGAGESIHISAGSTTTYYARVESLCDISACASATLTVMALSDFDQDADVDLADFAHFQACFNGPNRPPAQASGCENANLDGDATDDVDLSDFAVFQGCFNGPNRPPACQ